MHVCCRYVRVYFNADSVAIATVVPGLPRFQGKLKPRASQEAGTNALGITSFLTWWLQTTGRVQNNNTLEPRRD